MEGSILKACLGSKPSYAWRNIHGAIDLLQSGLIWRIGDGAKVGIWGENGFQFQTLYGPDSTKVFAGYCKGKSTSSGLPIAHSLLYI
jgi:hypothetical protein